MVAKVAASPASAEPPGGALPVIEYLGRHRRGVGTGRRLSRRVARARRHRAGTSPPVAAAPTPLLALAPTMILRLVGGSSQLGGRPSVTREAGPAREERGEHSPPTRSRTSDNKSIP